MKLKLIALAVAGMAAAGSANAVFDAGTGDFNGNSELFLFAVDGTANIQGFLTSASTSPTSPRRTRESAPTTVGIWPPTRPAAWVA